MASGRVNVRDPLWRGGLLPLGREAAPHSRKYPACTRFTTAAPPSGSKLPRHRVLLRPQLRTRAN
ncbi:hypothetical protein C1884_18480 [Pseudomonas sp. GW460-R15]|nr:hypothetical protein C1887_05770 [Pseudomonas sp. GW456-R21]POA65297.1 hypothetical protein C1884_18480 [Pseudomonas sp. GW460-R15]